MAKEAKTKENEKVQSEATQKLQDYFELSKLLFGLGEQSPYDINELKEDNPFCQEAKNLAEELEIDWEKMTHEESNRIMLSLLDDFYNRIKVDDEHRFLLAVNIQPKKGVK